MQERLSSRKIVGWALADHMGTELVTDAPKQALGTRSIAQSPTFHSDVGCQSGLPRTANYLARLGWGKTCPPALTLSQRLS